MTSSPTFYIFHGTDDLQIEEEVSRMIAKFGDLPNADLNTTEFDGTATPVTEILGAAMAYPFMADKRVVIVKDLLAHITRKGAGETGKKAIQLLVEQLPTLPEWTRLIFVERTKLPDTHKIVQKARESGSNGYEKAFTAPKDSSSWIVKRAQEYGTKIEPSAAAALASVTSGDLRRADNELVKLISYVNGERTITEADVALLTPYVTEASMFEMVDALAEGRAGAAAKLIRRLFEQEEDVFSLFGMIIRQFRLLLLTKEHLTFGGSRDKNEIAAAIGAHPYAAEKLSHQSRRFTLAQLEQIYRTLHDYDVKMKTGRIEPELALDLLIAGLGK
jgi:DNA polymerase-3 subunit delta